MSLAAYTSKTNNMHNKSMTTKILESYFYRFFLPNFPYYGYFNWNLTKKYSFSVCKAIFLITHDALEGWQNSNQVVFSFIEDYLEGKWAALANFKANVWCFWY